MYMQLYGMLYSQLLIGKDAPDNVTLVGTVRIKHVMKCI